MRGDHLIFLSFLALILFLYLSYELIFWCTHRNPLSESETKLLAEKRRIQDINKFYYFVNVEMTVDKNFKSKMIASGGFFNINEKLSEIPALSAALLKSKKHEWILIAFEKNQEIKYLWMNKGLDNKSAKLLINSDEIVRFAESQSSSTVLMFHNHPNSNPNLYNHTNASQTDMNTADHISSLLSIKDVNHIAFVCERGRFYRYFYNYTNSFFPIEGYIDTVYCMDNTDKKINYRLHKELRRLRNITFA